MISVEEITKLHDQYLLDPTWPNDLKLQYQSTHTIFEYIEANHFFNTKLWNEEDLARRKKVPDNEIANNKRAIDSFNQNRNDYIEKIDNFIFEGIPHLTEMRGKQNSETLGAIIDRLSILSLKIFHMSLQTLRDDVEKSHIFSLEEDTFLIFFSKSMILFSISSLVAGRKVFGPSNVFFIIILFTSSILNSVFLVNSIFK